MNESITNWAACIVYYQDLSSLQSLINNLNNQTLKPSQIFIADNASSKDVFIQNSNIPLKIIKLNSNLGFGAAANAAIKNAIENGLERFILLSQDVLLEADSCQKLIDKLNKHHGIVFPTMYNRKTNNVFSKGGVINKFTGKIELKTKKVPKKIYWADGSCLCFDKKTYLSLNGFSEQYFMYFEDVDFCLRAYSNKIILNHVETNASQNPNGPNPFLRSRNSVLLSRNYDFKFFKLAVLKRNILAALLLLIKLHLRDSWQRFVGIYAGLKVKIEK